MIIKLLISFLCFHISLFSNSVDFTKALFNYLQNDPKFDSLKKHKEIRNLELKNSYYSFFPNISLNASSNILDNFKFSNLHNQSALSLSIKQSILHNSINIPNYKTAVLQDSKALLDIEIELNEICFKITKVFYDYCATMEKFSILQEKIKLLANKLDSTKKKYQQGLISQRDLLRFESLIQQAKIQIIKLENSALEKKSELEQILTNKDDNFVLLTSNNLTNDIPNKEPDISNSALFKKLSLENNITKLNIKQAHRKLWPQIWFNADISSGFNFTKSSDHNFKLGINLSYDIFSFGKNTRDIQIASIKDLIQHNDYTIRLNQENIKAKQTIFRLKTYQSSITLNKKLIILEEANFLRIKNEYLVGKAQYLDLISALDSLNNVKIALSEEIFALNNELLTYHYYEGKLYEWLF